MRAFILSVADSKQLKKEGLVYGCKCGSDVADVMLGKNNEPMFMKDRQKVSVSVPDLTTDYVLSQKETKELFQNNHVNIVRNGKTINVFINENGEIESYKLLDYDLIITR